MGRYEWRRRLKFVNELAFPECRNGMNVGLAVVVLIVVVVVVVVVVVAAAACPTREYNHHHHLQTSFFRVRQYECDPDFSAEWRA